eukprot:EG_transcript_22477
MFFQPNSSGNNDLSASADPHIREDRQRLAMPHLEYLTIVMRDSVKWQLYDYAPVVEAYRKRPRRHRMSRSSEAEFVAALANSTWLQHFSRRNFFSVTIRKRAESSLALKKIPLLPWRIPPAVRKPGQTRPLLTTISQ